jgi:BioD-like phosphotransacetylase family protein
MKRGIFVAATGQHVGKTTTCLGIISGLQKRYSKVGFIKPVGQVHVMVEDNLAVDKDVVLFKECFHLSARYSDMSPVLFPSGFTRNYLDGQVTEADLQKKILKAYTHIYENNDFTIVEGTGHIGVGSIVNLNNAAVAAALKLDVVLIASGGLGSAFDELALNRTMCQAHGVKIRGVILNRVLNDKRDMVLEYFPKALKRWGIPLLGCVPYNAFLSLPSMHDFENLFNTSLISGQEYHYHHFQHIRLVDTSAGIYRRDPPEPNQLIITPATREDIILATLAKYWNLKTLSGSTHFEGGMILTGRMPPRPAIVEKISRTTIPCLYAPVSSYKAMQLITSYKAKIQQEDTHKIQKAIQLVEPHIDFDLLTQEN